MAHEAQDHRPCRYLTLLQPPFPRCPLCLPVPHLQDFHVCLCVSGGAFLPQPSGLFPRKPFQSPMMISMPDSNALSSSSLLLENLSQRLSFPLKCDSGRNHRKKEKLTILSVALSNRTLDSIVSLK